MGLDNFWVLPDGIEISFEPELHLCGGMFSGNGKDSFRGKVYAGLISELTGISIYKELITEDVIKIAEILEPIKHEKIADYYNIKKKEFNDIKRMFKKYGEAGASLKAWY